MASCSLLPALSTARASQRRGPSGKGRFVCRVCLGRPAHSPGRHAAQCLRHAALHYFPYCLLSLWVYVRHQLLECSMRVWEIDFKHSPELELKQANSARSRAPITAPVDMRQSMPHCHLKANDQVGGAAEEPENTANLKK